MTTESDLFLDIIAHFAERGLNRVDAIRFIENTANRVDEIADPRLREIVRAYHEARRTWQA